MKKNGSNKEEYEKLSRFDFDDRGALEAVKKSDNCDKIKSNIDISTTERNIAKNECEDHLSQYKSIEDKKEMKYKLASCKTANLKEELVNLMEHEYIKKNCGHLRKDDKYRN